MKKYARFCLTVASLRSISATPPVTLWQRLPLSLRKFLTTFMQTTSAWTTERLSLMWLKLLPKLSFRSF